MSLAAALGGRRGAAHLLRLVHTDGQDEGADSGGYSVTVIG